MSSARIIRMLGFLGAHALESALALVSTPAGAFCAAPPVPVETDWLQPATPLARKTPRIAEC
jgi:hypothetical protein